MHHLSHLPHLIEFSIGFALIISAWFMGRRMRKRIKQTLGIKVEHESELTSLNTWMRVMDAEERAKGDKSQ